jgi:hypothetical protein
MRIVVLCLLLLSAHFSLTAFAPAQAGKAWVLWPFAADSQSALRIIGGLPAQSGSVWVPLLAGVAGLAFLAAAAGLFNIVVPANWWMPLIVGGATASVLLYALFFGPNAMLPLLLDAVLLWGVLAQHWTVAGLRGV